MNWFVHLLKSSARARVSYACSVCVYVSGSVCVIVSRECVCEYGAVSVLVNLVCVCARAKSKCLRVCEYVFGFGLLACFALVHKFGPKIATYISTRNDDLVPLQLKSVTLLYKNRFTFSAAIKIVLSVFTYACQLR